MSRKRRLYSEIIARAFLTANLFVLAPVELAAAPNVLVDPDQATRVPVGQSQTSLKTPVVAPVSEAATDRIDAVLDGENVVSQSAGAVDPTDTHSEVSQTKFGVADDNAQASSKRKMEAVTQVIGDADKTSDEVPAKIDDTAAGSAPEVRSVDEAPPAIESPESSDKPLPKKDDMVAGSAPEVGSVDEALPAIDTNESSDEPLPEKDDTLARSAPEVGSVNEASPAIDADKASHEASPIIDKSIAQSPPAAEGLIEALPAIDSDQPSTIVDDQTAVPIATAPVWGALDILGEQVEPGTRRELHWSAGQSFAGSSIDTPVVVVRGAKPGPTLCLTAAVHGDELNGVEITRRVLSNLVESELAGTVIGVPIVNLLGFSRGSRYLPDRRDLNRYFPGAPNGSSASRIAYVFFKNVILNCDRLVDFHTGSDKRTNLPQLRADLKDRGVREFVGHFGATAVLHKKGGRGTLRGAATDAGIPAVAFELGAPVTLQLDYVEFGVKALDKLIAKLDMLDQLNEDSVLQPISYRSHWLRAPIGGILSSTLRVGVRVKKGDVLGVVTNPLNSESSEILSQLDGRVLGRALNQFVLPGFATFHVGVELAVVDEGADESDEEAEESDSDDENNPQQSSESGDGSSGDFDEDMH
ncbi:MAG: succinylglutamate desuccinylase/aspartoacylase family protein [Proteobacteria bacterium]|nr:succinylglutamate desuccinylase/aspartoacylase family protein [Pseudomonadota bacterium]